MLRTDNALKFKDKSCSDFYATTCILHQKTCPYKPQQNARVERRHRYILEMARALKFQSGVAVCIGGECVLTSVYIMNRFLSSVLNKKSPYELLYEQTPEFEDMRAFGCLAFAANPTHSSNKFERRGVPCVFMGYTPNQKGYRLLNLSTKDFFVSRDVVFKENVFPFNKYATPQYLQPLPVQMPDSMNVS